MARGSRGRSVLTTVIPVALLLTLIARLPADALTVVRSKDVNPGPSGCAPTFLREVGGTLYFGADDGVNGTELWRSDGTAGATVMVKDINTGPNGSGPGFLRGRRTMVHGWALWPLGKRKASSTSY